MTYLSTEYTYCARTSSVALSNSIIKYVLKECLVLFIYIIHNLSSGVLNNLTLGGSGTLLITNSSPASVNVFNPSNPFLGKTVTLSNLVKVNSATSGTLIESGTSTAISAAEELYVDTNGQYKAINDVGANEQTLITSFTNLPNAVTAGSGGSFYTGTIYSRLGYTCGTSTSSFTVASETNTSLLVTFTNSQNTQQQAVGQCSTSVFTSQIIYRLTANGITLVKRTASDSNFTGSLIQTFQQASDS